MIDISEQTDDKVDQYLSFMLEDEIFAVEISKVREVLDYTRITRVPRMPDFLKGVINLRGHVITVVDLKLKLGFSPLEVTRNTCIIIVEVSIDNESSILGLLADSVREVFDMADSSIEPPPKMGLNLDTKFIRGMGKQEEEFVIILDIDFVLSTHDKAAIAAATELGGDKEESKTNGSPEKKESEKQPEAQA